MNGCMHGAADWRQDVPDYTVVAGNPARIVRMLRPVNQKVEGDSKVLLERLDRLEAEMRDIREKLLES